MTLVWHEQRPSNICSEPRFTFSCSFALNYQGGERKPVIHIHFCEHFCEGILPRIWKIHRQQNQHAKLPAR